MPGERAATLLHHVRALAEGEATDLTDAELLRRFATRREEAAFAALLRRHGRLVWGVCRRVLHWEQDAEDAFQATFLVLARRTGAVRKTEAVGSFLHGVAHRIAMKAKRGADRRQNHERRARVRVQETPPADLAWRELQAALDEEISRLPAIYRGAFVLCCLEGRSRVEAARELGCQEGTVSSRITRARDLLKERLARRGVTLPAALCAGVFWGESVAATAPAALHQRTIEAIVHGASATVTALAEGVVGVASWRLVVVMLGVGLLAVGAGVWGHPAAPPMPAKANAEAVAGTDRHGDPLPPGALARFGTVRQRAPGSHLAVTADGKQIVAVDESPTVRRFDAATGRLLSVRQLPRPRTYNSWISPRGSYFVTPGGNASGERILELWDLAKGQVKTTLPLPSAMPWNVTFTRDECQAAVAETDSGYRNHRVFTWDVATGKTRTVWTLEKEIRSRWGDPFAVFSPDGKRLVTFHLDQIVRCFDAETGKPLWQAEKPRGHPVAFFHPDGRTVVMTAGDDDNDLQARDAATGKPIEGQKPLPKRANHHPLGFTPDGKFLAFLNGQQQLVLWEPGKKEPTHHLPKPPQNREDTTHSYIGRLANLAFTPDGKAVIHRAGALHHMDLDTGKLTFPDTHPWGHAEPIVKLAFSPDGKFLASTAKDHFARLWDVATSRPMHAIPKGDAHHLAFTADSRQLLSTALHPGYPGFLQATDVIRGNAVRTYDAPRHDDTPVHDFDNAVLVTADGAKVMILCQKYAPPGTNNGQLPDECRLSTWDTRSRDAGMQRTVPWNAKSLFTPDGRSVLTVETKTARVKLMALDTEKPRWYLQTDEGHGLHPEPAFTQLAVAPDNRLVAVRFQYWNLAVFRTEYGALHVADLATGRRHLKLPITGPAVFAFSPDGRQLAVADTRRVQLFETATGQPIGTIPVATEETRAADRACATTLAFAPDGTRLATGHEDGTILLWDATLGASAHAAIDPERLWADLAGDAAGAYAALGRVRDDRRLVALLKARLRPVDAVPATTVRPLLDDLGSDRFAAREAAEDKLLRLGVGAVRALHDACKATTDLEKRRRVERVLAVLEAPGPLSGEALRGVRATHALERVGSPEARGVLEALATGVEAAPLTRAANDASSRLKKR